MKSQLSIGQVLAAYNLDSGLIKRNHQLYGPCPLHRGDNKTAFRVHLERGLWHCFTACGGGDIVDLIRLIERCSYAEAARHLYRLLENKKPPAPSKKQPPYITSKPNTTFVPFRRRIPLNPRVSFLQDHKKITVSTAAIHEAGVAESSSFLRGTIAVRLYDLVGRPLGYCGRRLDHKEIASFGKWRFPKNFPKSEVLFNAHRAKDQRKKGIVVVECPWAAMRLAQSGIHCTVALLGTNIAPIQAQWLSKAPTVLLMLDGDKAGRNAALTIAKSLRSRTQVIIHQLPDGMEPEDLTDTELYSIGRDFLLFL